MTEPACQAVLSIGGETLCCTSPEGHLSAHCNYDAMTIWLDDEE